jgi:CheY-like chemotaxis protein
VSIPQLPQTEAERAAQDQRRDEFLVMLAHEMRNPLAPILNAIHLLQERGPASPDLVWAREMIDRQVLHLGLLIDELITVTHGGAEMPAVPGIAHQAAIAVSVPDTIVPVTRSDATIRRIIVVDDHAEAAATLAAVLLTAGQDARWVTDGAQAIRLAEDFRPHAMVIDLGLPLMDGSEIARRIRRTEWGRTTLLIALTGQGTFADRDAARSAGFDHFLLKPVTPRVLIEILAGSITR